MAAAVLEDAGVRLALEFAAYAPLATLASAIDLCAAVGWERCGLLIDSCHALRGDAAWDALESLTGEQITLVHLNDAPPEVGSDPVLDSRFRREPPGQESSIWRASST
jgi:sugar phosphate isomerase/epimerase